VLAVVVDVLIDPAGDGAQATSTTLRHRRVAGDRSDQDRAPHSPRNQKNGQVNDVARTLPRVGVGAQATHALDGKGAHPPHRQRPQGNGGVPARRPTAELVVQEEEQRDDRPEARQGRQESTRPHHGTADHGMALSAAVRQATCSSRCQYTQL
jgi:hypothetical protein